MRFIVEEIWLKNGRLNHLLLRRKKKLYIKTRNALILPQYFIDLHNKMTRPYTEFGNLGSTMIKRLYITIEILLSFFIIADILAKMDQRWAIKADKKKIISILSFMGVHAVIHFILLILLAFHNQNIEKYKIYIANYRPIVNLLIMIVPSFVLMQFNKIFYTFQLANMGLWALMILYAEQFLYHSLPHFVVKNFETDFVEDVYLRKTFRSKVIDTGANDNLQLGRRTKYTSRRNRSYTGVNFYDSVPDQQNTNGINQNGHYGQNFGMYGQNLKPTVPAKNNRKQRNYNF